MTHAIIADVQPYCTGDANHSNPVQESLKKTSPLVYGHNHSLRWTDSELVWSNFWQGVWLSEPGIGTSIHGGWHRSDVVFRQLLNHCSSFAYIQMHNARSALLLSGEVEGASPDPWPANGLTSLPDKTPPSKGFGKSVYVREKMHSKCCSEQCHIVWVLLSLAFH